MRRTRRTYLGVFFIAIATVVFLTAHDIQAFAGESDLQYKSTAEKQRSLYKQHHKAQHRVKRMNHLSDSRMTGNASRRSFQAGESDLQHQSKVKNASKHNWGSKSRRRSKSPLKKISKGQQALSAGENTSASISGSMKDAEGKDIEGCIFVYDSTNDKNDLYSYSEYVCATKGLYSITNLSSGKYNLFFYPEGNYISEWNYDVEYNGTPKSINAVLDKGGSISGSMKNDKGEGIEGFIDVYDIKNRNSTVNWLYTENGEYTIEKLPTGQYKIFFDPTGNYIREWYDDKEESNFDNATEVQVTAPNNVNIDAVLKEGRNSGTISGSMKNDKGEGIEGFIEVYTKEGEFVDYIYTINGEYKISRLPCPGEYRMGFFPVPNQPSYKYQWYNKKSSFEESDTVSLQQEKPFAENINAELVEVKLGSISGRMQDAQGKGIAGYVDIYDTNDDFIDLVYSDDGSYTVSGLPAGSYKVEFDPDGNYLDQWYNNAEPVLVEDGVNIPVNMELASGGASISGRMQDAQGNGIAGYVDIYNTEYELIDWNYSVDGSYTVSGLPQGSYKVFFDPEGNYIDQWYDNKGSIETAKTVSVEVGKDTPTPPIDAVFAPGGSISGRMQDAQGNNISISGYVWIYNTDNNLINWDYSVDGSYTVSGLPAGEYKVFFDPDGNYLDEWYNNKGIDIKNADSVSVNAAGTTSEINAKLALGGSISGRMQDAQGNGIAGHVYIYDTNDKVIASVYSYDGNYIVALLGGSYKIFFKPEGNYIDQWYNNKELVSVDFIEHDNKVINAVIARKGSIVPVIMLLLQ